MATCLDPRVSISHMYYINHPQGQCTILEVNAWRLVESHPRREMNTWAHGPREAMTVVAVGHQLHVPNTVLLPLGPTDLSTGARTNRSVSLDPQPMRMRGGGPMRCRQWKRIKNHLKFRDGSLERSYGHEEVCQVLRLPAGCGVMGNRDTWRLQRGTTLPGYGDSDLTRQQRPTPAPAKE